MKSFDDIIRNSVEGYKAPYNPSAWENVSNQLNSPMDQAIKESVDKFQAPANAQVWSNISNQLGPTYTIWKWIGGTAAAITLIFGSVALLDNEEVIATENDKIVQNVEDNDSNNNIVAITNTDEGNVTLDIQSEEGDSNASNNNTSDISNSNEETSNELNSNEIVNSNSQSQETNSGEETNLGEEMTNNVGVIINTPEIEEEIICNSAFNCNQIEGCVGSEFTFSPEDLKQDVLFVWSFGDNSFSTGKIANHTFKRAGDYTVTLSLKDKKTNKSLKYNEIEIIVNPIPNVDFAWEDGNSLIPSVNFINLTEDAETWTWDIKGLATSTNNEFDYTFRKKGTYIVSLEATNEFSCTSSIEKPVTVEDDYNLFAPTAFSPNGDNDNDEFIPMALPIMDNPDFIMSIYDKSGKLVYQTNNVNQPWDGRSTSDNTPAPAGAYVWSVELTNENGDLEIYKGQVIIIR